MTHTHIRRAKKDTGFKCPSCNEIAWVLDSRPADHGWRRRRGCVNGHRITTREIIADDSQDFSVEIWSAKKIVAEAAESLLKLDVLLAKAQDRADLQKEFEGARYGNAGNGHAR